jgi:hypothetical protein
MKDSPEKIGNRECLKNHYFFDTELKIKIKIIIILSPVLAYFFEQFPKGNVCYGNVVGAMPC